MTQFEFQETSQAAAESIKECATSLRMRIFDLIRAYQKVGLTCDEAEHLLDLRHQTCSARIYELRKLGRIVDSGARRKTRSGRKAIVWVTS